MNNFEIRELSHTFTSLGISDGRDTFRGDIYFAIARALESLRYGKDMSSSSLVCIDDSIMLLNESKAKFKINSKDEE